MEVLSTLGRSASLFWRVIAGCPGLQVEQVQFAHLCTTMSSMHHRRAGYPFGTLVDFASDGAGFPIFCMSPLAIHTRNIVEDCRCSLVVQMPGWAGLANARVTIFGDVFQLPPELQEPAREVRHICNFCSPFKASRFRMSQRRGMHISQLVTKVAG